MKNLFVLLLASITSLPVFGAVLLTWDTSGIAGSLTGASVPTTLASNFNDSGLSASTISVGSGLTPRDPTDAGRFQFSGFDDTVTLSFARNAYFEWTITPDVGQQFTLTSFDLGFRGRAGRCSPLRLINLSNGSERILATVPAKPDFAGPKQEWRVDLHPSWCSDWRHITFNGWHEGRRAVFLADLGSVL